MQEWGQRCAALVHRECAGYNYLVLDYLELLWKHTLMPLRKYHKLLCNSTDKILPLLADRERETFSYKLRCFVVPLPQVSLLIESGLVGLMRVLSSRQ